MKVSLCLLTLNEIVGCKHDVPLINKIRSKFDEVFAVDNGSTDGTVQYLRMNKIPVIYRPGISYDEMHSLAIKHTKSDAVVFFPPKGTNSVSDTLKFEKYFKQGYGTVVASRLIKGGSNEEDKNLIKLRKWLTILLAFISAVRWKRDGNTIWDVLHVFRGTTVAAYKKAMSPSVGQTFDIDHIIRSYKFKISRVEFPTKETPRLGGSTHFKTIPFGIKILRYLLKEVSKFN